MVRSIFCSKMRLDNPNLLVRIAETEKVLLGNCLTYSVAI